MSRRRDGATGQPLVEGVYEDVVTEQLARGLEASTIAYVVEELGDADAHVTLARHLGREIERALATLPRDRRAEQARVLAAGLLDHLATLVSEEAAELVRDQRPPPPVSDYPVPRKQAHAPATDDLRVLSVLTTWLGVHHAHVNADRLVRFVAAHPAERVRAYWSAVATWLRKDRRFARLTGAYDGAPVDVLPIGVDFQIRRRGEDERFAGSKLRVPRGTLRDREEDVLPPEALVRRHAGYRNRVLMGPTWRADVWTVLEHAPELSVAEVARRASCSFATAWQVAQDFRLLQTVTNVAPFPPV